MTSIDIALLLFNFFNAIRFVAYFSQMAAIVRDTGNAAAISYWTWSLFAASHLSTVFYAVVAIQDAKMAALFGLNAICCISILFLTVIKRHEYRRRAESADRSATHEPALCSVGLTPPPAQYVDAVLDDNRP